MRYSLLIPLLSFGLFGQTDKAFSVTAGVKIGSPVNDPSSRSSVFNSYTQSRWTGGPTVELHLPYHFALEFDALYRTFRTNSTGLIQLGQDVNPYTTSSFATNSVWDLPLMLKYRFHVGPVRPFVSAGFMWTHQSTDGSTFYICSGAQGSCRPADSPFPELRGGQYSYSGFENGPVAGAGLEFRTHYVTISPELRFSRFTYGYPRDNRFTALVGFTFGHKR
jgi:hypothetical protein